MNPTFRRLIVTIFSNEFAGSIAAVAIPLLVLELTGSAAQAGLVAAVGGVGFVASQFFSGAITDRFSAFNVLRLSSLVQALAAGVLLALVVFRVDQAAILASVVLVAALASSFDSPSEHSIVKRVVPQADLGKAASIAQGRESLAGLLGGPATGVLLMAGAWLPMAVMAFFHSLATALAPRDPHSEGDGNLASRAEGCRTPVPEAGASLKAAPASAAESDAPPMPEVTPAPSLAREIREGFAVVWNDAGLRGTALIGAFANVTVVAVPLILLMSYQRAGVDAWAIGLFASCAGLGVLVGSTFAGWLTTRLTLGTLGIVALAAFTAGQGLLWAVHGNVFMAGAVMFLSTLALPAFNSAIGAYTTAVTPEHLMGRVVSASGVPGMILMPLGAAGSGILLEALGPSAAVASATAFSALALVLIVATTSLRTLPRLDELTELSPVAEPAAHAH
ncbi:MFS transporter [Falsarthrobacter nasiphocae]|uniref:MFS family permease n=1 Tax=Falsarthrobacter nasiphocae TaxID=189863 RepID=A0AAE3YER2_9MICC|nr:MFS transporter [Falsarthrobacter nasiphocae]MDR6891855.1 MFS family permease [Falsarthrobacter nasiphocae]